MFDEECTKEAIKKNIKETIFDYLEDGIYEPLIDTVLNLLNKEQLIKISDEINALGRETYK